MKKLIFAGLLCAMVCVCAPGAAGTVLNVDLPKETLTEDAEDGEEANGYVSIWATDAEGTLLDGFNASLAEGEQLLAGETWTFEKRIGSWVTPEQEDTIETGSVGYRLIR